MARISLRSRFHALSHKRQIAVAGGLAAAGVLVMSGAAFAYFGLSSTSTPIPIATANTFVMSSALVAGGTPLSPGLGVGGTSSGSESVTYLITNPSTNTHTETLTSIDTSLKVDGTGNVIDSVTGNPVPGCLGVWFQITDTAANGFGGTSNPVTGVSNVALTGSLAMAPAPGANNTEGGTVVVTMPTSSVNQSACAGGISPWLQVTAS